MPAAKATKKDDKKTEEKASKANFSGKYTYANGKRKSAIARVRIYKGSGNIVVNDKSAKEYFSVRTLVELIKSPFKLTGNTNKFDISAKIIGGGVSSQAEALRHGIAKGLVMIDEANKQTLKKAGLLTRDARTKERKKYGLKRARKAPQFSKR